jgi:hypothetical protein
LNDVPDISRCLPKSALTIKEDGVATQTREE